jgi:hypothetical protein
VPTGNSQSWAPNNAQSGPPSATADGVGAAADAGSANAVATADPDRTTVAADVGPTEPGTADCNATATTADPDRMATAASTHATLGGGHVGQKRHQHQCRRANHKEAFHHCLLTSRSYEL